MSLKKIGNVIIALLLLIFFSACGEDSDDSSGISDNEITESDMILIKDLSISGVSQKGPFITGSVIKLYELDSNYTQTGKTFTGKIKSDDGKFSVSNIILASPYALLEVNGYFRNEITGKKSNGTISLNALADLSNRKTVNINLLTHLECERALYLVKTGDDVVSAKKQAEEEILKSFGIEGEFANSEDLNVFSKGDGNAALLAFSVLLLRDLSEADFTEQITKFAMDIESDGSWDDDTTKAKIADWAYALDSEGGLLDIRGNIEKWKLGPVPSFEKFVRNFWYMNYGLGNCNSENKGEVLALKNEFSTKYSDQIRFICKDDAWVEASDFEKDLYKLGKDKFEDGEFWTGRVTGKKYKYNEKLGEWENADSLDILLNRACTDKRVGSIIEGSENVRYYCSPSGWFYQIMVEWSFEGNNWKGPREIYLNPDITYGTMVDERDMQEYKTIKIGEQIWMAQNLNYASLVHYSTCYMLAENCSVAGRLYSWTAAIDSVRLATDENNPQRCGTYKACKLPKRVQGVCPDGWHLPDTTEWKALFAEVGGSGDALRSQTAWAKKFNGTDAVGFSALPAGMGINFATDGIDWGGEGTWFWSTVEADDEYEDIKNGYYGKGHVAYYANADARLDAGPKSDLYSVRCIKD